MILGTGTNVGKTHVTRALALALRTLRPDATVAALKPIESGFAPGPDSDANRLADAATPVSLPQPHPLFALPDPVSPHLAARRAGLPPIHVGAVVDWLTAWETCMTPQVVSCHLWSLVETAGAVFSPLSPDATNFELAKALDPALWVLVAPDCLGVLHDVRVTWEACDRRGRVPDYLVLSAARAPDASTGTNIEELRTLGIAEPVQSVGRDSQDLSPLARALVARFEHDSATR